VAACCRIGLPIPDTQYETPRGVGKGRLLTPLRHSRLTALRKPISGTRLRLAATPVGSSCAVTPCSGDRGGGCSAWDRLSRRGRVPGRAPDKRGRTKQKHGPRHCDGHRSPQSGYGPLTANFSTATASARSASLLRPSVSSARGRPAIRHGSSGFCSISASAAVGFPRRTSIAPSR
jgi:hypothetical protein